MTQVRDSFVDLDRYLTQLSEHVDKLIIALDEWRQWKEEYESLRVEVKALPSTATQDDRARAREGFEGDLVGEKELIEIFGPNDSRKRDQILSTLTNRLDYVTKNVDTLTKQLEAAENKLASARVVSNPDATDEDGLPFTEITEELDEDDNVLSYNLRRPGDNQPQLLEALKKAGVKDLPSDIAETTPNAPAEAVPPKDGAVQSEVQQQPEQQQSEKLEKKNGVAPKKKSVAFSEDTKSGEEQQTPSATAQRLEEILKKAKEQESMLSDPVIPADDTPEEASMREDMIRYNKQTMEYEMAPIVAELQLEDGDTDDDDWDEDDEDDEDEDAWGRSTSGIVDDDWKQQMLELKERLSKHVFNEEEASDNEDDDDDENLREGLGRVTIRNAGPDASIPTDNAPAPEPKAKEPSPTPNGKKKVSFASALDIADAPAPSVTEPQQPQPPAVDPLSDVTERTSQTTQPAPKPNKKPSRFRASRANPQAPTTMAPERPVDVTRHAPTGPEGTTLAASVLEHEPTLAAREPDEFDATLLQQQVAEEYHKMRNRLVHRQGGFLKEDEDPIQPLDEEEGGPPRMSRFRAARLGRP
ncbi:Prefoldin subunit-domain-containing protein [Xylariomycetidae sp. FL0641]|nr:Prefoldin subunit-domain-containing protein [Xylariomycetidae sp. FL0641]